VETSRDAKREPLTPRSPFIYSKRAKSDPKRATSGAFWRDSLANGAFWQTSLATACSGATRSLTSLVPVKSTHAHARFARRYNPILGATLSSQCLACAEGASSDEGSASCEAALPTAKIRQAVDAVLEGESPPIHHVLIAFIPSAVRVPNPNIHHVLIAFVPSAAANEEKRAVRRKMQNLWG